MAVLDKLLHFYYLLNNDHSIIVPHCSFRRLLEHWKGFYQIKSDYSTYKRAFKDAIELISLYVNGDSVKFHHNTAANWNHSSFEYEWLSRGLPRIQIQMHVTTLNRSMVIVYIDCWKAVYLRIMQKGAMCIEQTLIKY